MVSVADSINTKAVANSVQPDYLNSAAHLTTIFSLREFFEICVLIEKKLTTNTKLLVTLYYNIQSNKYFNLIKIYDYKNVRLDPLLLIFLLFDFLVHFLQHK